MFPINILKTLRKVGTERWNLANASTGFISGNCFCKTKEMLTNLCKRYLVTANGTKFSACVQLLGWLYLQGKNMLNLACLCRLVSLKISKKISLKIADFMKIPFSLLILVSYHFPIKAILYFWLGSEWSIAKF